MGPFLLDTPGKFNSEFTPENRLSQKESSIPIIHFSGAILNFRGGKTNIDHENQWLEDTEDTCPFGIHYFQRRTVSFRECSSKGFY